MVLIESARGEEGKPCFSPTRSAALGLASCGVVVGSEGSSFGFPSAYTFGGLNSAKNLCKLVEEMQKIGGFSNASGSTHDSSAVLWI